ncbi:hypothetical protein KDW_47780 [Dictyobacter vulcani]|uniref:OAA-family lectin sugar binding domain-containing protein n=1 Tax=Dictyobacter vulcani TaxID=2607529 RepID=A0A5J4KZH4_9CHLR|nr:hypothetical protein [Dictyobacter vulcani]GER90616.1 hypothetical protein KDW_47780 [Dictyobacter vulcani]
MQTENVSPDRRNFMKSAGSATLATLLVTGGAALAKDAKGSEPTASTYTYATQNSWGPITQWHTAADLSFSVDAGTGSLPASLSWRDQQGNSFSISFASDMSSFFGYFQRINEGPIAYRGTRK